MTLVGVTYCGKCNYYVFINCVRLVLGESSFKITLRVLVFCQFGIPYQLNCSKTPLDTSLLSWEHIIQTAHFLSIMQKQQFIFNLRALRSRTLLGQSCWLGFPRYQLLKFNVLEQEWTKHYIFNLILCFKLRLKLGVPDFLRKMMWEVHFTHFT